MHVDLSLMTLAACALAGVVPWSPDEDEDAVAQGEEADTAETVEPAVR